MAIAGGAIGHDLGEGRLGLAMLAGLGERSGGLESGARLGRLFGFPPAIAAPSRNRSHDQYGRRHRVVAVALPQLFELLASDFLVDFLEDVGHETLPRAKP